jgi:hypothetical protein
VAQEFINAQQISQRYQAFKAERDALTQKQKRQQGRDLERKHGLGGGQVAELKIRFVACVDGPLDLAVTLHPALDIALLKFSNFAALGCKVFPVFGKDGGDVKQGKFLCRLGFPFPEFTNFAYDAATDAIDWNDQGRKDTPRFPIEGMVTRHSGPAIGVITGFELSTPGLRGQSGGPAFDVEGRVWGMQSETTTSTSISTSTWRWCAAARRSAGGTARSSTSGAASTSTRSRRSCGSTRSSSRRGKVTGGAKGSAWTRR